MSDLKGDVKKHIELIKSEKDIENIIQKGGEAANKTVYAINEFKELMSEFNKFRYHIQSQNLILKSQEEAVKNKEFADVEKAAIGIQSSFEEEKKFYQFLLKKEQEERIEILKAFGDMKDVTLLGDILTGMTRSSQELTEIRTRLNNNYQLLETIKKMMGGKKIESGMINDITAFQREVAKDIVKLEEESRRIMETEKLIYDINSKLDNVREQKAKNTNPSLIKKALEDVSGMLKNAKSLGRTVEAGVANLNRMQQKTEEKKKMIIKWLKEKGVISKGPKKKAEVAKTEESGAKSETPKQPKKKLRERLEEMGVISKNPKNLKKM